MKKQEIIDDLKARFKYVDPGTYKGNAGSASADGTKTIYNVKVDDVQSVDGVESITTETQNIIVYNEGHPKIVIRTVNNEDGSETEVKEMTKLEEVAFYGSEGKLASKTEKSQKPSEVSKKNRFVNYIKSKITDGTIKSADYVRLDRSDSGESILIGDVTMPDGTVKRLALTDTGDGAEDFEFFPAK